MPVDVDFHVRELLSEHEGMQRRTAVDPNDFIARRLICALADAWLDMSKTLNLSYGTRCHYRANIVNLGTWLDRPRDRALTLTSDDATLAERLFEWESSLSGSYTATSVAPGKIGKRIRRLIQWHHAGTGVSSSTLSAWSDSPALAGARRDSNPLDEFSNGERLRLEGSAREVIRQSEKELLHGRDLLRRGCDPRNAGWDCVPNYLWAVHHLRETDELRARLLEVWTTPNREVHEFLGENHGTHRHRGKFAAQVFVRVLYPNPRHLMALRLLILLGTGLTPEETKDLTTDDVQFEQHQVTIRVRKRRSSRTRLVALESDAESGGGWRPGDLLRRADRSMRLARAASRSTAFWITPKSIGSGEHRIHREHFEQYGFAQFIAGSSLEISEPHDIRRLRKTVKSVRAAVIGTMAGGAGDDHSIEVFQRHYAQSTTVHVIAAQTINRAQTQVFDRMVHGPTLVVDQASAYTGSSDSELSALALGVARESAVEQQLATTACRSPYESPFVPTGQLCHASPTLCLRCPNAVVFVDHLPRLLFYGTVLDHLKESMAPAAFAEVHGQQLTNLRFVLDKFTPQQIEEGEKLVAQDTQTLHLPLGQRVRLS